MRKTITLVLKRLAVCMAISFAFALTASATGVIATSAVYFAGQAVGTASAPHRVTILNEQRAVVVISKITTSIPEFSFSSRALPVELLPGRHLTVSVTFTPPAAKTYSGTLEFVQASGAPISVALDGVGDAGPTFLLEPSTALLDFDQVAVSSSRSLSAQLTNIGNQNVTVLNAIISGSGFDVTGIPAGTMLAPGQSATFTATFHPSAQGSDTGWVTFASDATNPVGVTLMGTAIPAPTAPVAHSVQLSWSASNSTVIGYNAYWSAVSGGPYTKLTSTPDPSLTYTDASVQSGQTYYFVVTSVDSSNNESPYSGEVSALVP